MNKILIALITFSILGCSSMTKQKNSQLFTMKSAPVLGKTLSEQKIYLGGFSGLVFLEEKEGSLYFQTITDRGPNGELQGSERPFLLPEFTPQIITLKADLTSSELTVVNIIDLKNKDNTPMTGLPQNRKSENPIDVFGVYYSIDQNGMDSEGLARDEQGYWVSEEYGPSLIHFNFEGKMQRRFMPNFELPKVYASKKTNRGFEAIVKSENKVFGFLQSPLPPEISNDSHMARIVELDLDTMKTSAEYFYPFHDKNEKIGDAALLDSKNFLVLEQNGKTGDKSSKLIYKITLDESDKPVKKTLIASLEKTPFNNYEKIEGLALIDSHRIALVYDNDFQVSGDTDKKTGLTPLNQSLNQLLLIEFEEPLFK